jgi:methylated-DNA-[protein]-cysteine S-methyltransferase
MSEQVHLYARESSYLGQYVQLSIGSGRVRSVSFPGGVGPETAPEYALLDRIVAYLAGSAETFADVAIDLTLPESQCAVLEAVRELPYREQVSVERLTQRTAGLDSTSADAHRLARTALAANPAPLLIPDHRVRDGPSAAPPRIEMKLRSLEGL